MQTRVEKWKNHRAKIKSNSFLSEAIINSDKELKASLKELFKFFPDIEGKIKTKQLQNHESHDFVEYDVNFEEYQITEIDVLLQQLEKIAELTKTNLAYLNKIDFSSHQLDDLINKLK